MNSVLKLDITAPSNIALVKYWGKKAGQLPQNPSISMTLNNCTTRFACNVSLDDGESLRVDYKLDGQSNDKFADRIEKTLTSWQSEYTWLAKCKITIDASNSFPHSAGIASSASAFAALATLVESVCAKVESRGFDSQKASYLARLGSGSACRSITGNYNIWGKSSLPHTCDDYAINYNHYHHSFSHLQDVICIVSQAEKKVSSSQGHKTMEQHNFAEARYQQARENVTKICHAMEQGDWNTFGSIVEQEALTLHGLMMSANDPFILLAPESLEIIHKIWDFRRKTDAHLYFTIDAGPNIHLLFPKNESDQINDFIQAELVSLCYDGKVIKDHIGPGVFVEFH